MTSITPRPFGPDNTRFVGPIVAPRPDETFYSWIGRIAACLGGMEPAAVGLLLFAGKSPIFYPDLPVGLGRFIRSSGQVNQPLDKFAAAFSGYVYYANFMEPDKRTGLLSVMSEGGVHPAQALGMNSSHVRFGRMRYCSNCHEEMVDRHGNLWWRRTHQLPSNFLCPDHGTFLIESNVDQVDLNKGFSLPSTENCPPRIPLIDKKISPALRHKLLLLAKLGRYYLENFEGRSRTDWAESYVLDCRRTGLANGHPQAMVGPVHSELKHFWTGFEAGALFPATDFERQGWVHRLLLGNTGMTPLQHLMMQTILITYMNDEARIDRATWLD